MTDNEIIAKMDVKEVITSAIEQASSLYWPDEFLTSANLDYLVDLFYMNCTHFPDRFNYTYIYKALSNKNFFSWFKTDPYDYPVMDEDVDMLEEEINAIFDEIKIVIKDSIKKWRNWHNESNS